MRLVTGGATSVINYFQMRLTAGGDATGLTITDFDMTYTRTGATPAAKVDAVALAAANTAWTSGRGIEVDPTDAPGLYRFDFPDAAFAAGVDEVVLTIKHASCFTESLRVEIDGEVSVTEWNGVKLATTNPLPNAAADAAGGLPISDAGALDIDAKLANTNEVTAARMGALTDWINGGRLDLLLDAIKAVTDNLPDSGALTTIGTDTARLTAARAGALTDWINGGRLDLLLDAIPTTAMRGTDSAATEAKQDIIDTNVDSILVDTTQIKADLPIKITKNAAYTNFMFKMVDSTDGYTEETGLSVTATRSLGGAAFGACANAVSEVSDGWYKIDLDAADTNGDPIILRFTATGARDTEFIIIPQKTT